MALVAVMVLFDRTQIPREERYLQEKFGEQYSRYKAKVKEKSFISVYLLGPSLASETVMQQPDQQVDGEHYSCYEEADRIGRVKRDEES